MFPQGHALLMGIGSYAHAPEHDVPITVADTRALHAVLCDPQFCGYPADQITVLHEAAATRAGILTALDDLAARTTVDDTVLLFYSGHGCDATDGTYALTTHDTQFTPRSHIAQSKVVLDTGISEHEFIAKLRAIPAERVLVIINACYAGSLAPTLGESDTPVLGQPFPEHTSNALLSTGAGRIIMTACREDQVSFIGLGELTIFARALVDGLRGRGVGSRHGYISAFDLYSHLYFTVTDVIEQGRYGRPQEPELTVLKGVGPFAVSLYRGATTLGDFPTDHRPAADAAVREVPKRRSQRALQHLSGRGAVGVGGDVHAPITTGDQNTMITSGRDTIQADGDVTQVGGDYVGGDKISGDITVRDVHGSGIAIGHKGHTQSSYGGDADAVARAFAQIYTAINARPPDPDVDQAEITKTVQDIQAEAQQGDQANDKKLRRWLHHLAGMAEDIFDVTVAALTSPQAALATVARKVAVKAKQEREQA